MGDQAGQRHFFSRCSCCGPAFAGPAVSRRSFLSASAAVGLGLAAPAIAPSPGAAQAPVKPRRIDVHHHCIPPAQAEAFSHHRTSSGTKW